jgi:hypothetical protein
MPRGRPRIHPVGTTASARVAHSTAELLAAGGARKTFRLSPKANDSLRVLMAKPDSPKTETALIERLLLKASGKPSRQMRRATPVSE